MRIKFNPENDTPLSINRGPSKRPGGKWRFRLLLLVLFLPFIIYFIKLFLNVVYPTFTGYLTLEEIPIKAPISGYIDYIKPQGENVSKGETLIIIKNNLLENQRKMLFNYINQLNTPKNSNDIKERLYAAENLYKQYQKIYQKYQKLKEEHAALESEVENAFIQMENARLNYLQIKQSLNDNPINNLTTKLDLSNVIKQIDSGIIKSPINAIVSTDYAKKGEYVNVNSDLLTLQSRSNCFIKVFINPKYLRNIKVGETVTAYLPDGSKVHTKIINIETQTQKQSENNLPFSLNTQVFAVIILKPTSHIPEKFLIDKLPIKIKLSFDFL